MANIFITRKCNLKCPYCFADEFVNKANEEMSIENFKTVLNFVKTEPNERVGIIGGEPTLHPKFNEILDIIISDEAIKSCIVFTNGLEIDKYIEKLKHEKINILVNCNPPADLGSRYDKLKENIKLFSDASPRMTLGINLYSDKMDYSYIFELLKIVDQHKLRFSTALPNSDKEETTDALNRFNEFKPFLFRFFEDCLKNEIVPTNDCNAIPVCLLDTEEKRMQIKIFQLARQFQLLDTIMTTHGCSPVIDILPDMTAVRCFGLSKYLKVPINDFAKIDNLRKYFFNKIDLYARLSFEKPECEDCKVRLIDKCGLCYTYKIKNILDLKESIKNRVSV